MRKILTIGASFMVFGWSLAGCLNIPDVNAAGDLNSYVADFIFKPDEVQSTILGLIRDTRKSITISLYGFENEEIADALIEAKVERDIDVRMSSEYDSATSSSWQKVINMGIPVRFGNRSGIMHNKYLIFDDKYLITGSTNLTRGMFRHFNNTLLLRNGPLIEEYKKDFLIQDAGYYSSSKDSGYDQIIGGGANIDWEPERVSLGKVMITPYFTPYKKTISQYTENILNSNICPTDDNDTGEGKSPFRRFSSDKCFESDASAFDEKIKEKKLHEIEVDCYDHSRGEGRTIYRFFNHDLSDPADAEKKESERRPKKICSFYNHALNIVVKALRTAKRSVSLLVFAFTDRVIFQELIRAKHRGIDVKIWMDRNQYRSSFRHAEKSFANLRNQVGHFRIVRRSNSGLLHHKVIIIDDNTVILGSMNFSSNAVNTNDENFLLLENAQSIVKKFKEEIFDVDQESYPLPGAPESEKNFEDAMGNPNQQ